MPCGNIREHGRHHSNGKCNIKCQFIVFPEYEISKYPFNRGKEIARCVGLNCNLSVRGPLRDTWGWINYTKLGDTRRQGEVGWIFQKEKKKKERRKKIIPRGFSVRPQVFDGVTVRWGGLVLRRPCIIDAFFFYCTPTSIPLPASDQRHPTQYKVDSAQNSTNIHPHIYFQRATFRTRIIH